MDAHWRLYAGQTPGPALDLTRAEIALLPTGSAGASYLRKAGWTLVYADPLASVLLRDPAHYPTLAKSTLPVSGGRQAVRGRAPFPDAPPRLSMPADGT